MDGIKILIDAAEYSELEAYRATNHTPEECAAAFAELDALKRNPPVQVESNVLELAMECSKLKQELAAYRAAEQNGTLLRLPCNENSMLYSPRKNDVLEQKVQYITIGDGDTSVAVSFKCDYECVGCPHNHPYRNYEAGDGGCDGEDGFGVFLIKDFGKTVFLTRPDAEATLKEQEGQK